MQPQMPIELYVHPVKGDDTFPGNSLYPFKTLTRALQKATPDTLIQLSRGTYNAESGEVFPLIVTAGITITGNVAGQGGGVVIDGGGLYKSPSFGPQMVTLVPLANAEIRGVTVINTAEKGTGIWIETGAPTIAGCTLTRCGREGMLVTGTGNPMVSNCVFQENQASGLTLVRHARGEIRNSLWRQNRFGIAISDRAAPLITSNQYLENRSGIVLSGAAAPVLRGNVFAQNQEDGLAVFGSAQPDLGREFDPAGNRFRENQGWDLRNATPLSLISSGNQLNPTRVSGMVEFVTARSPALLTVSPQSALLPGAQSSDRRTPLIQPLLNQGIVSRSADGQFHAEEAITGMEFQRWLQQAGFKPDEVADRPLTRLQAIAMLVPLLNLAAGNPSVLQTYRDRVQVPSAQTSLVATAIRHRLIIAAGSDQLNLFALLTKADAAILLYQALVTQKAMPAIDLPDLIPVQAGAAGRTALPSPERPPIVLLDPGHGGADAGVVTKNEPLEPELMGEAGMMALPMEESFRMSPLPAGGFGSLEEMMAGMPPEMVNMPPGMVNMPPGMAMMPLEPPPPGMPPLPGEGPEMPDLEEKTITLSVAQAIANFLQQQGVQVFLTRNDDRALSLDERLACIEQHQAEVMVSLHANANIARQADINGIETYHNPDSIEATRLAWAIHKTLTRTPDVIDRGVHPATFYLLRQAAIPTAHLEVGYITGKQDASSLANLAYHRYLGRAIANGILRYVRQKR